MVEVESAREQRPSFDEIFAILVARHRAETGEDATDEPPTTAGGDRDRPASPGDDDGDRKPAAA